jgi:hypothetical protein
VDVEDAVAIDAARYAELSVGLAQRPMEYVYDIVSYSSEGRSCDHQHGDNGAANN